MFEQTESITQNTIVLTNSELETIAGGHDKHHCHHHHHKPHCHKKPHHKPHKPHKPHC
jgi:hypothetical protein